MITKNTLPLSNSTLANAIERVPDSWRYSLIIWAASRLLLCGWGLLLWFTGMITRTPARTYYFDIQPIEDGIAAPFLGIWLRWDAVNYLRLAQNGIHETDLSAFFPLFSLLGRWTSFLFGGNMFASLMAVSNVALLLAMVLLYKIVEEDYSAKAARYALLAMVSIPGAVFFYTAYPHSLALALILGAYWAARHARWSLAFICGCLSGLAHPTALPVFFLLGYLVFLELRKNFTWPKLSLLFVPVSALAGSFIYFAWRAGAGYPSYGTVCFNIWNIVVIFPWQYYQEIGKLFTNMYFPMVGWVNLLVLCLVTFLTIFGWKKVRWEIWLYQFTMLAYYLSFTSTTEPMTGFARFTIMMFPQYIELGMLLSAKWARVSVFVLFWILQFYLLFLFFSWMWVG